MKVYSPTSETLVLFASDDLQQTTLLNTVKELMGVVAAFGIISVIVDYLVRELATSGSALLGAGGGGAEPAVFPFPPVSCSSSAVYLQFSRWLFGSIIAGRASRDQR
jgi:hypothetical protein